MTVTNQKDAALDQLLHKQQSQLVERIREDREFMPTLLAPYPAWLCPLILIWLDAAAACIQFQDEKARGASVDPNG
jgi:hypothetical protein